MHDIVVNVRRSRGKDIDAACGQLANKSQYTSVDIFCNFVIIYEDSRGNKKTHPKGDGTL